VHVADYEAAKAFCQKFRQNILEGIAKDEALTEEQRAVITANWLLGDLDEDELAEHR